MNIKNKLFKDNFIYAAGSISLSVIAFLVVPLFTRLLSPDEYGVVNTYNAYLNIFGIVIGLGLNAAVKNAKYEYEDDFEGFNSSVTLFSFIIFAVILTATLFFGRAYVLIVINSYAFFLFTFISDKFFIEFKHNKALLFQYINTLSGIVLSVVLINVLQDKAFGRILGNAMPTIMFGMAIFIALSRKRIFRLKHIKYALSISCPLLVFQTSYLILTQFDRVLVSKFTGDFEAGVYSFVFNIGLILNIIYKALWNVWYPWFFKKADEKDYVEIRHVARYFIVLFSFITIAFLSVYPEMVTILAPSGYWGGMGLVVPISVAIYFYFLFGFPLSVLMFSKKNIPLSASSAAAVAINISLNVWLLPRYGYEAAAYVALLSFLFLLIAGCVSAALFSNLKIYRIRDFILGASAVCVSAYVMIMLKDFVIARLGIIAVLFLVGAAVFYKEHVRN